MWIPVVFQANIILDEWRLWNFFPKMYKDKCACVWKMTKREKNIWWLLWVLTKNKTTRQKRIVINVNKREGDTARVNPEDRWSCFDCFSRWLTLACSAETGRQNHFLADFDLYCRASGCCSWFYNHSYASYDVNV